MNHEPTSQSDDADKMFLDIIALSARRKGRLLFQDLCLKLFPGEILGLFGANGSGKTTLLECLVGLQRPTSGKVILNGEDLNRYHFRTRIRKGISFLSQQPMAVRNLNVADNLSLFAVAQTDPLVEQLGITPLLKRRIRTLSAGESRKVDFCLTVLREATVYVLDEPFAGIEPRSISIIVRYLDAMRNRGKQIVIADHLFMTLLTLADKNILVHPDTREAKSKQNFVTDSLVKRAYLGDIETAQIMGA
jgi:lipopolysaccharide export system ATP-binding protein